VFPFHALTFACRFIVAYPCFNAHDNLLQESLPFFTTLLQKLHAYFYAYPFVLICKLLWHPTCTKVHVEDGICRSTADVQLVSYINNSNPYVSLNQSIASLKTVCHLQSGWMVQAVYIYNACSATLETFHPLVHLPLGNAVFSELCQHSSVNIGGFYPL
jgi:hypothetical protein